MVLPTGIYRQCLHVQDPWKSQESNRSPETGVRKIVNHQGLEQEDRLLTESLQRPFKRWAVFGDRVFLCIPGCLGTQDGLILRDLPSSTSQVLGSKVCAIVPDYLSQKT